MMCFNVGHLPFISSTAFTPSDQCSIELGSTEDGDHICYYASGGGYSSQNDPRADLEGYVPIVYGEDWTTAFYNDAEIVASTRGGLMTIGGVDYFAGNVLPPGAEIALTFKLGLPEPCVGNFNQGTIKFWGEAI